MPDVYTEYEAWQAYWGYPDARSLLFPPSGGAPRVITFPTTGLKTKCRIALSANLSEDWRSWSWLDISERVRWDAGVTITSGKRDRDPNVPASTAQFSLTNIDGELSRQNVFSSLFGSLYKHNPIWITTDVGNGEFNEFFGFTQELPKRSDTSGSDAVIQMTCKGPLDHIFRSKERVSPLRIACIASAPLVLWTLEEEASATQAASALTNGSPMVQTGTIAWASSNRVIGAKALPNMRSGSGGTLVGSVPNIPSGSPGAVLDQNYILSAVTSPEDFASGSWNVFHFDTQLTTLVTGFSVNVVNDGTLQLVSSDAGGGTTVRVTSGVVPGIFTEPKLIQLTAEMQDASFGDTIYRLVVNNVQVATVTLATFAGLITSITLTASSASEAAALGCVFLHYFEAGSPTGVGLGNVGVTPNMDEILSALTAHTGDMVHQRIARVCRQQGISFYTSAGVSQRLGPQPIDTPINIIRNAEVVDGVVYEFEFGLGYKATNEYARQPVSIALDIAEAHIVGELQPADDTTKFYNQWTVTRQGGSSSTQQKDGGISANEEIFPNETTLNIQTDAQAALLASFFANRDSSEADRWPYVKFALQKHPELIPAYQGMPYGGRVTVANMRTRWGVTALNLTVEGKVVFFNSRQYEITLNSSDASIHDIGQLDGGQALDSRSTTLFTGIDAVPALKDTFDRTLPSTWGEPNTGPQWTISGAGIASVANGVGTHAIAAANDLVDSELDVSQADVDLVIDFQSAQIPVGGNIQGEIVIRYVDNNNFVHARILARSTNDIAVNWREVIGGVAAFSSTVVISGVTATSTIRMRVYAKGSFLAAKAWNRETSIESPSWNVTLTTAHLAAGKIRVRTFVQATVVSPFPIITNWDNVNEPATIDAISADTNERITTDASDYPVDITMLGERLTAVSISEPAFDLMDRTAVDSFGISSSGHQVTNFGGAATDYQVNAGVGKVTLTSVNVMRHCVYNPVGLNDIEFSADVRVNVTPTGGGPISCWLTTRWLDTANYYDAILLFDEFVRARITVGVRSGGVHTLISGISGPGTLDLGPFTVGNFWRIHMRSIGNTISAKAWEVATQAEPSTFQVSGTANNNSGVHPIGGDFAIQNRLEIGNTNVNPVVEWDNVHVLNPQRLVVTRNVNGVERAHPAGRPIHAADPFILGL